MSLPSRGKLLALDLGSRRTGIALSDENQQVAFMRPEIEHLSPDELLFSLKILIEEEKPVGLIIGLPLDMKGQSTKQTSYTQEMIDEIKKMEVPIISLDERLTTQEAAQDQEKGSLKDSRAAQILMQAYFSSKTSMPGSDLP